MWEIICPQAREKADWLKREKWSHRLFTQKTNRKMNPEVLNLALRNAHLGGSASRAQLVDGGAKIVGRRLTMASVKN